MSRSARRERLDCFAAREAANIRPYSRAASASKGIGSQVAVAQCKRSWRRARSSLSSVAWGPAASSARVMAQIADSSGSDFESMRSWSITTEVSSSPRVGSVIDALIDHGIDIRAETAGVDPWRTGCSLRNGCTEDEPARPNRPEFGDRRPVSSHHDGSPRLNFPEHCCRLIPELPLCDDSIHRRNVANVALCSNQSRHRDRLDPNAYQMPPRATVIASPFTPPAASLHRNAITCATSRGSSTRFCG